MKKEIWGIFFSYPLVIVFWVFFLTTLKSNAQCAAFTTTTHCTTAAPIVIGNSISCTPPSNDGGRRNFMVTNMSSSMVYRISNCGSTFDTQITVFNENGTVVLGYNDDNGPACTGTAASLDFIPPTNGNYRIQLNRYNCSTTNQTSGSLTVTLQGIAPSAPENNFCINAIDLSCNTSNLNGTTSYTNQVIHNTGCSMSNYGVWYTFTGDGSITTLTLLPSSGYDPEMALSYGNCGTLQNLFCVDQSGSGSSESLTFTSQIGIQYYLYISHYSSSSSTTGSFTLSRTCTTPCTPGSGEGTTTNACPSVISGGLGLNGQNPPPKNCNDNSSCVELEATYLQLGQTSNYTVESIDYNPPYQFSCLQNPVSVNADDVWSPIINLPFQFCFYGNTYQSCTIGSNGIISFNTSLAGNASGYQFNANLPSLASGLFGNSIYGVYHDIDPSEGGEVGWELITLNTGCRALVASWNDVPMFNNNSILYTGMIVLYENTNVIEVYVREKNLDSYSSLYSDVWNWGNAIIGIQNSNGTLATVAPNRNGLSTNWTATQEAWRFIPSGNSITTITWYEGSGTNGNIVGNTDIIEVCPYETTIYTAEVTYTLCNGTTLIETAETTVTVTGEKIWNGSVDNDWDKDLNWTPTGKPSLTDCVVIPVTANNPSIMGTEYQAYGGTLRVLNNASLTVESNNVITLDRWCNVANSGLFYFQNNASLIQLTDAQNTGNINYNRNALVRRLDYVYWSSPVANCIINSLPAPLAPGPMYYWDTTYNNPNGGQGYWIGASGHNMIAGKGYIMRSPNSFSSALQTLSSHFIGTPNNGPISLSISRGNDTNTAFHTGLNGVEITHLSDNYNLLGNPYPSSIRGSQFLLDNPLLDGNIKIWTHGTLPSIINSPFYDSYLYNYSPGDYLTYTFTGTNCCPTADAELFIGAGQGFFAVMEDGPTANGTVTFYNHLRNASYTNDIFYRPNNNSQSNSISELERHRFWIDIINENQASERILIGYIENATIGHDKYFDSKTSLSNNLMLYSLFEGSKYNIQGRPLPFDRTDRVPLGYFSPEEGNNTIAIAANDGLFEEQDIFLIDNYLNIIHDLKSSPYSFYSTSGTHNERFVVVYQNELLSQNDMVFENNVKVLTNQHISIYSSLENLENVSVYNILGQNLANFEKIQSKDLTITTLSKNNNTLLLVIQLENQEIVVKKIRY